MCVEILQVHRRFDWVQVSGACMQKPAQACLSNMFSVHVISCARSLCASACSVCGKWLAYYPCRKIRPTYYASNNLDVVSGMTPTPCQMTCLLRSWSSCTAAWLCWVSMISWMSALSFQQSIIDFEAFI